ncbi:MAG: ribosome biogenesis GTPase Der [Helicobacteraceae bacterium]|jgi:GTP-binding protein|nr:ribosome biogenesis GTPase Der [Helicobacteraceae bacterium]
MRSVALVGRPNAGKSTLFNRLIKSAAAVTSAAAGTTRDIRSAVAEIGGKRALIVDTGGLAGGSDLFTQVHKRALKAANEADITLFMADGQLFPDEEDRRLFFEVQKSAKSVALVINKMDSGDQNERYYSYLSFGSKQIFPISCAHKRGFEALEKWLEEELGGETVGEGAQEIDDEIKVAIIGRPNVGKSALLNALVGFERSIVSGVAGTTIDPVNESVIVDGKTVTFIDTAGIRKRGRIEGIERFAFDRTEKMLESADIALITLDASEEFSELDERIAGLADRYKTGMIVVLNKLDIATKEHKEMEKMARSRFTFLSHAPLITLSAHTKKRVNKLFELILSVYENYSRRITTSELNALIETATDKHHIPSDKGKAVKIYYATQYETKPPRIALITNRPSAIHFSYLRYLANQLRLAFDLSGTPLVLEKRGRKSRKKETVG